MLNKNNFLKTLLAVTLLVLSLNFANAQTGTLNICSGTDDNVYALNVYTTATTTTPLYFQLQFETPYQGEAKTQTFIQWETYSVDDKGDENPIDQMVLTTESGYRRYATDQPYYFTKPGKYVVYAIDYYKRATLEHRGYKEYLGKASITITN